MSDSTYTNPVLRTGPTGNFADPFVLRFDGRYYLYATNPDICCWTSDDLISWQYQGPTIEPSEFPGLVPFAPEVTYWNGVFYMVTSPSGLGHYLLASNSPTGPFKRITPNFGRAIDGNVFIDDDGQWYFYWAGDEGIWASAMHSPTEFGEPVLTEVTMDGWTEGPFVSKEDGWYTMTLTGNHFLSPGYRINAARSRAPLSGWEDQPDNPILVQTDTSIVGLGHSSSVVGPNLVTTYIAYHNLNPDRSRDLNIDRQVYSDGWTQILGPSSRAVRPEMPVLYGRASSLSKWIAQEGTLSLSSEYATLSGADSVLVLDHRLQAGPFAVEINLESHQGSSYGILLQADTDAEVKLLVAPATNTLTSTLKDSPVSVDGLPNGLDHNALHCWVLRRRGDSLDISVDGMLVCSLEETQISELSTLAIVTEGSVSLGSITVADANNISRAESKAIPVPGTFWATLTPDRLPRARSQYSGPVLCMTRGDHARWNVLPAQSGRYRIYVTGEFTPHTTLELSDPGRTTSLTVEPINSVAHFDLELPAEQSPLELTITKGAGDLTSLSVVNATTLGDWSATGAMSGRTKSLLNVGAMDDLAMDCRLRVKLGSPEAHADVLFRAGDLAEGGEGNDAELGIDFFRGYAVELYSSRATIVRNSYRREVLAETKWSSSPCGEACFQVTTSGARIEVEFDDGTRLEALDPQPLLRGDVGLRVWDAEITAELIGVDQNS